MNNMRAFVRYDSKGIIVPTSFVMKKSKPKVGNWLEISTTKSTTSPPNGSSLGNLRAFVRYNAQNRIVPGSVVVRSQVPQNGNWGEITYSTARPISGGAPLILQYTITAPATQISIPLGSSAYSFEADWGDGTTTGPLESADGTLLNPLMVHTYADPGVYNITISGSAFPYFNLYSSPDAATKTQLTNIVQWGSFNWESFADTFRGCTALTSVGSGNAPILTLTTSLESMFNGCTAITDWSNLATWNTSAVTSLESTFNNTPFNDVAGTYVAGWNVANVASLYKLFANTLITTIDLSSWNVSSVTDMAVLFGTSASLATANLNGWDVSNVTNMNFMFAATAIGTVTGIENWQISQVNNFGDFMFNCPGLSTVVYDQLLVNWDAQGAMSYAGTVDFGCSVYTEEWAPGVPEAEASRTSLIAKWGGINDCGGTPVTGFIIEIDTEGDGLTPGQQTYTVYKNPGVSDAYNYNVETSDGQTITGNTFNTTITFPSPGIYKIKITGTFPSYYSGTTSNQYKIKDVISWGPNQWTSFYKSFYSARRMVSITATNAPDLSNVTDMRSAFESAERLVSINNLAAWDVSNVTQMQLMFHRAYDFNEPGISSWNTLSVTDMSQMFFIASDFNQSLSGWDTSSVTNMSQMFQEASNFNGSLAAWDTSNVTNMYRMFRDANNFNQNIGSWNVSNVSNMVSMFTWAYPFNNGGSPDIGNWDVSSVIDMTAMFASANSFNQDLSNWNMSSVSTTSGMFSGADSFNNGGSANINNWNVTNVTNMSSMFAFTNNFNQPIGNWNTSNVVNMDSMFRDSRDFNQDIGSWDVSNVTDMENVFYEANFNNGGSASIDNWDTSSATIMRYMFGAPSSGGGTNPFNQPIGSWNTSNVTNMERMFSRATSFNQDISTWNVSSVTNMGNMFSVASSFDYPLGDWNISNVIVFTDFMAGKTAANYSAANLDDIYSKWSLQTVSPNESISFGTIQYTIAGGQAGKDILTGGPNNWTITDGGGI